MQPIRHTLYHASPHKFIAPSPDQISANRTGHANGLLGLWAANRSDWIANFGVNIYALSAIGTTRDITIKELQSMGSNPEDFVEKRRELLEAGCDILRLIESDGRSEMSIIVNFDVIEDFQCCTPKAEPIVRQSEANLRKSRVEDEDSYVETDTDTDRPGI